MGKCITPPLYYNIVLQYRESGEILVILSSPVMKIVGR